MESTAPTGSDCWIGLNDLDNEGTFVWADGTNSSYRNWEAGQPNNLESNGDQDCVHSWVTQEWNDLWCRTIKSCYFCSSIGEFQPI